MLSGDGKTRRAGLSGVVASLVVAVPCVTRQVTWPPCACLGNGLSARVRRRRSGARCWLDQELVRRTGVTHYRPAAAVSLASDRHHRTLRTEAGGSVGMLADELDYVVGVDTHLDEHVLAVVAARTGLWWRGRRCRRTRAATQRRCGLGNRRPGAPPASGRSRAQA